jgi:ribose transport system ATP-binding protein
MEYILKMDRISKRYPGVLALNEVDFSVKKGEVHALVGENGAGKSTLMKILAGAIASDEGKISLNDQPVDIRTPLQAQELGISIIYQEFNLVPHLNATENIFLGHPLLNKYGFLDWPRMRKRSQEILEQLGVEIDLKIPVSQLGVARQQLIEIGKALSIDARLIIMDEPTAALSTEEIVRFFDVIRQLKSQDVSIIFITHHMKEIFEIADRATVLRDGVIVGVRPIEALAESELVQMLIGETLELTAARETRSTDEIVLSVRNLSRNGILNDISFDLRKGEILGLAGLMGSGRTELVRAIFGADSIDSGEISVNDKKIKIKSPRDAIRAKIGLAPEDRKSQGLVLILPIVKNITLSFVKELMGWFGIKFKKERGVAVELTEKLDIRTPSLAQQVLNLSGGNQQKVVLSKWLGSGVDIYLLDEPTRGIDVGGKEMIFEMIHRLVDDGASVILISSELEEVMRMSDRLLVMQLGRINGEFAKEEFDLEKILLYAMGKQFTTGK